MNVIIYNTPKKIYFLQTIYFGILYENGSLSSIEFQNELKIIPYIYFAIQYPTPNLERIYSEIIK